MNNRERCVSVCRGVGEGRGWALGALPAPHPPWRRWDGRVLRSGVLGEDEEPPPVASGHSEVLVEVRGEEPGSPSTGRVEVQPALQAECFRSGLCGGCRGRWSGERTPSRGERS